MIGRAIGWFLGAILAGVDVIEETARGIWDRLVENWPFGLLVLAVCMAVLIEAVD